MLFADYRATCEQDWGSIEREAYQRGDMALASAARFACDAEEEKNALFEEMDDKNGELREQLRQQEKESDDFERKVRDAVESLAFEISQAKRIGNREEIMQALEALQSLTGL